MMLFRLIFSIGNVRTINYFAIACCGRPCQFSQSISPSVVVVVVVDDVVLLKPS